MSERRHTGGRRPLQEGTTATPVMTKMPPKLIDELDAAVSELGTTRSALIRQALEKHLASLNSTATRRSTAA